MNKPVLVIQHFIEKYNLNGQTITDLAFNELSFLYEKEPTTNPKGEKVSKSYYATNHREAVRITYAKIIGKYTYKNVVYNDVFLGLQKTINFLDWKGDIEISKKMQPYYFNLQPVFVGDGNETVTGFSSPKMRKILKSERMNADDFLQSKNPGLYAMIYKQYNSQYETYLTTGDKTDLLAAINNESVAQINAVLNKIVDGTTITVKQLIFSNLQ